MRNILPEKVVVLQPGFIGDVVLVSPLLVSLHTAFPHAELAILVRPERARLAKAITGVDQVLVFDKRGRDSGPVGLARAASRLKDGGFDLLICPHRSHRTALLAYLSRVPMRVGFQVGLGRILYNVAVHLERREPCRLEQEFYLLRAVGVEPSTTRPSLVPPSDAIEYAERFMSTGRFLADKCIGLCIGANWPTKRWPVSHFASLADVLVNGGYTPLLFGGPADKGLEEDIQREFSQKGKGPIHSCVGNDLIGALGLLSVCAGVIGGDTGLVHMARAVDVPVVTIYGPTDERLHHHHDNDEVLVADTSCRPCHRHGQERCPKEHHRCMKDVTPKMVYEAVQRMMS